MNEFSFQTSFFDIPKFLLCFLAVFVIGSDVSGYLRMFRLFSWLDAFFKLVYVVDISDFSLTLMGHCIYVTVYIYLMEILITLESMILLASVKEVPQHLFSSW